MNERLNVFQQLVAAFAGFKDTDNYYTLSKQSTGRKIWFGILFGTISWMLLFTILAFRFSNNKTLSEIMNTLPEFVYYNNELITEQIIDQQYEDSYVYLNTDYAEFSLKGYTLELATPDPYYIDSLFASITKEHPDVKKILFVSRKNYILAQKTGAEFEFQYMQNKDLAAIFNVTSFSKASLLSSYKGVLAKFIILIGFVSLLFLVPGVFLIALFYSIIGAIINAATDAREDFGVIYGMSIYLTIVFIFLNCILIPLIPSSLIVDVICIGLYIFMMIRILKNGEPSISAYSGNSFGMPANHGVVNDDFDSFMKEDPFTAARNEANQQRTPQTTSPEVNENNNSYYGSAIQPNKPAQNNNDPFAPSSGPSSTGLSMRIDD